VRRMTAVPLVLVQVLALTTVTPEEKKEWPVNGDVVYVSRVLHPDQAPAHLGTSAGDFVTGTTEGNPVSYEHGAPAPPGLPACEPVEVRKVKTKSLRVRWMRDHQTLSTLGKQWKSYVFADEGECARHVPHSG